LRSKNSKKKPPPLNNVPGKLKSHQLAGYRPMVIEVSDESVTVETNTKTTVEVMVTSDTKFSKNGAPAAPGDLHIGDRVVIHTMPMKDGKLMAHTVQIGVAKASMQSQ